jgi:hypothetical protein
MEDDPAESAAVAVEPPDLADDDDDSDASGLSTEEDIEDTIEAEERQAGAQHEEAVADELRELDDDANL